MYSIQIHDPNEGLGIVMSILKDEGIRSDSRNGPVIRFPKPLCLEYPVPRRRILDHPVRDANHFFHLIETMWMFAGLDTVAPLDLYNEKFKEYSDDGVTFAAPYGYRWRRHFGFDQILTAVKKLRANPEDRRIVIQMWDPAELRKESGKDFACNQNIMLDTRPLPSTNATDAALGENKRYVLDMTVTNRSNDLVYGAMGSNLFHMSMLHEYIALHAGLQLGTYYQISKNMHLYLENPTSKRCWERMSEFSGGVGMINSPGVDSSLTEMGLSLDPTPIEEFVNENKWNVLGLLSREDSRYVVPASEVYLKDVVEPIRQAYKIYKLKRLTGIETAIEARCELAIDKLDECRSDALRSACAGWFRDKINKAREKKK